MTTVEHAEFLDGLALQDELRAAVDERTLEIVERRRRTAVVRDRGWLVRRVLLTADLVGLVAAMALAEWLVNRHSGHGTFDARAEVIVFLGSLPGWVVIAKLYGLYDRDEARTDHSTTDDFAGVFHMVTVSTWLFWALSYLTGAAHPTLPKLLIFWAAAIAFVTTGRAVGRSIARRNVAYLQNSVIVGAGDVGQLIAKKLLDHPEYGINLVGFIDTTPKEPRSDLGHVALLGGFERLPAIIGLFDIERVIFAFSNETHDEVLRLVRSIKDLEVQIDIVPRLFEIVGPSVGLHMIEGFPLLGLPPVSLARSSRLLKRLLDLALSAVALIVGAPVLAAIAIGVKLDSPGPVLYRHRRVGLGGRPIDVYKFRTMHLETCRGERYGGAKAEEEFARLMADGSLAAEFEASQKLEHDPRVTRLGRTIRKLSLDELPQLLNVLVGDLSLVGPRAITESELHRYGDEAGALLNIRPGITGYWQINGRSRLNYEDRVRLDLSYIGGWSLGLDLRILAKTMRVLFDSRGAV